MKTGDGYDVDEVPYATKTAWAILFREEITDSRQGVSSFASYPSGVEGYLAPPCLESLLCGNNQTGLHETPYFRQKTAPRVGHDSLELGFLDQF